MNFARTLSLVMPTFNRKEEIVISIKTILESFPEFIFKEKVELLILDNDSEYDIEDVLSDIITACEKKITLKIIKNNKNIGNDKNFLKGLCEAQGEYILQCSDRYYYNIDFSALIPMLENENPQCIIFSDRFRKYSKTEVYLNNSYKDEWLSEEFKIIKKGDSFFEIKTQELIESNYIKSGLINAFSDLILYNHGEDYFKNTLLKFTTSNMLGVTAQLDCISNSSSFVIFRGNYNSLVHQNIGSGNLYNRHNYNNVYHGNVLIQECYSFIGTEYEIKLLQIRGLMDLYLRNKAGLYYTFIEPDVNLIKSVVNGNKLELRLGDKINMFLINSNMMPVFIKTYIAFKDCYQLVRQLSKKMKSDKDAVRKLKRDFNS